MPRKSRTAVGTYEMDDDSVVLALDCRFVSGRPMRQHHFMCDASKLLPTYSSCKIGRQELTARTDDLKISKREKAPTRFQKSGKSWRYFWALSSSSWLVAISKYKPCPLVHSFT